jgi:GxxExxY protein
MRELELAGIPFVREVQVPISYKGENLDCGFRADIVVDDCIVLELKAVERVMPVHEAQLLTYLKLTNRKVGLLLNFNCTSLRHGIRRLVRSVAA